MRLNSPSSAINPNGWLVESRPTVTPISARGTTSQTIAVFFIELKRKITTKTIIPRIGGKFFANPPPARAESSASPPQAIEYPGNPSSGSEPSSVIVTVAAVCFFGSDPVMVTRSRSRACSMGTLTSASSSLGRP